MTMAEVRGGIGVCRVRYRVRRWARGVGRGA